MKAISSLNVVTTSTGSFAATPKTETASISSTEGVLLRLKIKAADGLEAGIYTARLSDVSFYLRDNNYNVKKKVLGDVPFNISVGIATSETSTQDFHL